MGILSFGNLYWEYKMFLLFAHNSFKQRANLTYEEIDELCTRYMEVGYMIAKDEIKKKLKAEKTLTRIEELKKEGRYGL